LQQEVYDTIEVLDSETLQYYRDNELNFVQPERRVVRHILICYTGAQGCQQDMLQEDALNLAEELRKQLLENPEDFETLAAEYSTGPSALSGGSIGQIAKGDTVAPFEEEAFSLQAMEISDVVETAFGYHIIRVDDIIPPTTATYQEVEEQIKQQLYYQRAQAQQRIYLEGIYNNATIVVID